MFALLSAFAMCHLSEKFEHKKHKIFPHMPADRIRHFECFNIVRMIDRMEHANKKEDEIKKALETHCEKLEDPRKNICVQIVPSQVEKINGLLKEKKRPDFICDSLGFSREFGHGRVISKEKCAALVDSVKKSHEEASKGQDLPPALNGTKKLIHMNMTHEMLKAPWMHKTLGLGVCRTIEDHEERRTCHVVARFTMRLMHEEVEKGADSTAICEKLAEKKFIKFTEDQQTVEKKPEEKA